MDVDERVGVWFLGSKDKTYTEFAEDAEFAEEERK